jgi:hypothetical protein
MGIWGALLYAGPRNNKYFHALRHQWLGQLSAHVSQQHSRLCPSDDKGLEHPHAGSQNVSTLRIETIDK